MKFYQLRVKSGFTLIDFMLVLVVTSGFALTVASFFGMQYKMMGNIDHYQVLTETINENILELRSKSVDDLPKIGDCLYRIYDRHAKFVSDGTATIGTSNCVDEPTDGIKVVWNVEAPTTATFNPAQFLKFPDLSGGIRQVQIIGFSKSESFEKKLSLTIFKEKKQ